MKNNNNLPRYVRVNAGVKAYSSAMHGELHQQLYNLIAAQDRQKLHLTDEQLKVWNDLIMQEVELNNAQQDTELTAKMQQLDDDRDALRGRSGGHTGAAPTVSFGWIMRKRLISFG